MKNAASVVFVTGLFATGGAIAHVGIANNTLPLAAAGQSAFAVANSTNEIVFLVPHGCNSEASPKPAANLDTTKIEITVPKAIVDVNPATAIDGVTVVLGGGLRPNHAGEFGNVARATLGDGSIKFTWTKQAAASADDDQLYKVSIRLKLPNVSSATDFSIRKYQFLATQTCANAGSDYVLSWGASSPTLLVFPDKRKGFNKYTLDASAVGDFAVSGAATKASRLKSYFGDAAIIWVGKRGYSPNASTDAKINSLSMTDKTYSNLGAETGVSLTTADEIWVKY